MTNDNDPFVPKLTAEQLAILERVAKECKQMAIDYDVKIFIQTGKNRSRVVDLK